jgi:hypothetical protein
MEDYSKQYSQSKSFISGACGGISLVLCSHPFDLRINKCLILVKVRLQTAPIGRYSGTTHVLLNILKNDGLIGNIDH